MLALLEIFLSSGASLGAEVGDSSGGTSVAQLATDRWLEMDLYWFDKKDIPGSVKQFWDRFQPLFGNVTGYRGTILNIGFTVSPVMEWSGSLNQTITLHQSTGTGTFMNDQGPLTGTTEQRKQAAAARVAAAKQVPRRAYGIWTYGDLKTLADALRQEAARRGIPGFKVGMLNSAWSFAYSNREVGPWIKAHPEIMSVAGAWHHQAGLYIDPNNLMHADLKAYGAFPQGIPEGTPFHQAYGAQWGSMSKAVGLDAIMFRDSFGDPVAYKRGGQWGNVAPSPEDIQKATAGISALLRECKQGNPAALTMMYSSGASAVADWRDEGFNLESIAQEGNLDIFVDQTWGGAWSEVGLGRGDFWNAPSQGWTFQLTDMLVHSAVLADTKVRHYPLVETFDAWEEWDVIHTAPDRLRWGIWANSHAAVKTPGGLKFPDGSYISWGNQNNNLLSEQDVQFIMNNLNAAIADTKQVSDVFGPTMVYTHSSMQWQAEHAQPEHEIKEWIDEQVGGMIKWPVPVISITRAEWLPQVTSDLFILQTPSHLAPDELRTITNLINKGQPVAIFGEPLGGIDPTLEKLGGLTLDDGTWAGNVPPRPATLGDNKETGALNIPLTFTTNDPIRTTATKGTTVVYAEDGSPMLTLNDTGGKNVVMWDPPELRYVGGPMSLNFNGDGSDYALAASALNVLLGKADKLHAAAIDLRQTMNVSAWRTKDGTIEIMAGNLEEGLRDDADLSRQARLVLPAAWRGFAWSDFWSGQKWDADSEGKLPIDLPQAGSALLRSSAASAGGHPRGKLSRENGF